MQVEVAHLIMDTKQRQEGPGEESCSPRNSPNGLLPSAELPGLAFPPSIIAPPTGV